VPDSTGITSTFPPPELEFGCDYCADAQNFHYGHVEQIGWNELTQMILLRCPRSGALYENTPKGEDAIRRLTESDADTLYPDREPE
jgi:hypothetical protein